MDILKLIFPLWPLDVPASFPDKELSRSRRVLLLWRTSYFVIQQSRSYPGSTVPLNRGNILNLVILKLLRDDEQRPDRIEVDVLVGNRILIVFFSKVYRCVHRCRHD